MDIHSTVSIATLTRRPARIESEIVIGKDILELLTGAMYADPLTVYREFVQNSADALDDAREIGLSVAEGPHISIWLDHVARTVRIRDIGIGVPNQEFVQRLTAIGASGKRGKERRGFRGVGRLSGLGYCQELIFRSRASKAEKVKELRWDSRILRERLRDLAFQGSLTDLIREVATTTTVPDSAPYPDHFFEVEMVKVLRIRNDILLNEDEIRSYLSQVAPVPFAPTFTHGQRIAAWLTERGLYAPLHIELNDDKGPVYHRAIDELAPPRQAPITFGDVEFLEVKNSAGEVLALGWLLDHGYAGAIPKGTKVGGIRLRCRGVQVGSEDILAQYFVEMRFAAWAAGDLHVLHPRIVPNGRRDEFEVSAAYGELQYELRALAKRIGQIIRGRSESRQLERRIHMAFAQVEDWINVAKNKQLHETTRRVAAVQAFSVLKESERFIGKLPNPSEALGSAQQFEKILAKLRTSLALPLKQRGRPSSGTSKGAHAAVEAIMTSTHLMRRSVPVAEQVLAALEGRPLTPLPSRPRRRPNLLRLGPEQRA